MASIGWLVLTRIFLFVALALSLATAPVAATPTASQVSCAQDMAAMVAQGGPSDCCDCAGLDGAKACQTDCTVVTAFAVLPDGSAASGPVAARVPPLGWINEGSADVLLRHTDPPPRSL